MAGKNATFEFLGTGTSTGVPVAGCSCEVCRSREPEDNRLRSSALVSYGKRHVVIDTGPEFRLQCLRAGIQRLDAVLLTHPHADHIFGLDDVRAYSTFRKRVLPVWGNAHTLEFIRTHFAYIWKPMQRGGGLPEITLHEASGAFTAGGVEFTPVPVLHGKMPILGYRLGNLAYLTDISALPESSLPLLSGVETLVVSCVRHRPHRTHLNIAGVRRIQRLLRPGRILLTHLTHYLAHRDLNAEFAGEGIEPAYDGLRVDVCLG